MLLEPREPFDFLRTLRFILSPPALLNGRSFAPLLDYFEQSEYRRVADVSGQPVLYGVSEGRTPRGLRVRILSGCTDAATAHAVQGLVERQFSTLLDLREFARVAAQDRVLSRLVPHFHGMRIPQATNIFETLISAILEQQVNLTFAQQSKTPLIGAYVQGPKNGGWAYPPFPAPASPPITTPPNLRRRQIS